MSTTTPVRTETPPTIGLAQRARDLLLAVLISLLALGVAEVALHLCGLRLDASLFQMDPDRDYSFRPNATGWHTAENDIYVRINDHGNRDIERPLTPPTGTLRIAVLGSSTTAGLEVEQQQTYTAQLEHLLSRPGRRVEVLNFAVEGYGPAQDFYTLQDHVWQFHPKIVMDEVSLKQYVLNSTRKYSTTSVPYPYFKVTDVNSRSIEPDPAAQSVPRPTPAQIAQVNRTRTLVNSIDLALLLTEIQKQLTSKLKNFSIASLYGRGETLEPDPVKDPWRWTLVPPTTPEMEQGWEICEGLMLAMRDQATAHDAEFWVIASDDAFQINPDSQVGVRLRTQMHANNLEYGDNRFDRFLSERQVHHIHLEPELLDYVNHTGAYLHGGPKMVPGEGHWNVLGHEVVAGIIARDLEQQSSILRQPTDPDHAAATTQSLSDSVPLITAKRKG